MKAEILSIGTELLLGTLTDTNAPYLAERLASLGIDCYFISQVGDNLDRLVETLRRAWERSELTVMTGGLGPTQDDLTREAIAALLGETPTVQPTLEAELRDFFKRRGYEMPPRNLKQATLIPSAEALHNPVGTAPGWWVERQTGRGPRIIVAMPGVPFEMTRMWEQQVEPRLGKLSQAVIVSRTLKVLGLGESHVDEVVADLMSSSNPTLAPYAKQDGIHLRVTAKAMDRASADRMISELEGQLRQRLGSAVYGADDDTPQSVARNLLAARGVSYALLEVGEGATGSVVPLLGEGPLFRGGMSATDLAAASRLVSPGGHESIEEVAGALRRQSGADLALAVQAAATPIPANPGAVAAEVEVLLLTCTGDTETMSSVRHTWRTAMSEVRRLAGLTAVNMLRLQLLS